MEVEIRRSDGEFESDMATASSSVAYVALARARRVAPAGTKALTVTGKQQGQCRENVPA